jgi:hypothetical protein
MSARWTARANIDRPGMLVCLAGKNATARAAHDGLLLAPLSGQAGPDEDVVRLRDATDFHPGHPA